MSDQISSEEALSAAEATGYTVEPTMADETPLESSEITVQDEQGDDEDSSFSMSGPGVQTVVPTTKKAGKKKKKSSSIGVRYPSQYMKIGEIKCLFLSCFNRGRSPVLSLGPSWPFTLFLLGLAAMIFFYFYMMIQLGDAKAHPYHKFWVYFCVSLNLLTLFTGILQNPGIPQRHIDRLLKEQMGKGEDEGDEVEMEDLESGANPQMSKSTEASLRYKLWCKICLVETNSEAYHCEDCDVCIEDYDHHCVFFSKCIGGGNIYSFWGAIGGVLFNFLNIALFLGMTAAFNGGSLHDSEPAKHLPQGHSAQPI